MQHREKILRRLPFESPPFALKNIILAANLEMHSTITQEAAKDMSNSCCCCLTGSKVGNKGDRGRKGGSKGK